MSEHLKISIVTPCFNMADHIERTIQSVLDQGYPNLEYVIIDGGSTDGTVDVIRKYEDRLTYWVSEKDEGMYDAINKGFEHTSGEIMGWLNADDELHPGSLMLLNRTFKKQPKCSWLTATNTIKDENGSTILVREPLLSNRWQYLNREFVQDGEVIPFGVIQQESTYWKRTLWETTNGIDTSYKYAGDFDLWMRFFESEHLYISPGLIGSFRWRKGQMSSQAKDKYVEECNASVDSAIHRLNKTDKRKFRRYLLLGKSGIRHLPYFKQKYNDLIYKRKIRL